MTNPTEALDNAIKKTMEERQITYTEAYDALSQERPELVTAHREALRWPGHMSPRARRLRQRKLQYTAALIRNLAEQRGVTFVEVAQEYQAKYPEMFK